LRGKWLVQENDAKYVRLILLVLTIMLMLDRLQVRRFVHCMGSRFQVRAAYNFPIYLGAVHSKQGYFIILVAISLSAVDIFNALRRIINFLRSSDRSPRAFWRYVVKKEGALAAGPEYSGIVTDEPEEYNSSKLPRESVELQHIPLTENAENDSNHNQTEQWANAVHHHHQDFPPDSEGTLFSPLSPHSQETLLDLRHGLLSRGNSTSRIGQGIFAVVERSLVIAGFAEVLIGIVIYTGKRVPGSRTVAPTLIVFAGGCRENYENGCLAHLISMCIMYLIDGVGLIISFSSTEGGIFWCYGLLTFARFLGAFADMGWSWNRSPLGNTYTAEFVESFVIFFYGATNTWMERFGANPGDPFTTKQIQHISIAVGTRKTISSTNSTL
jgi:hypothetical protein